MADCWAAGTYCAEWLPIRSAGASRPPPERNFAHTQLTRSLTHRTLAADKFCALAQADNLGSSASAVPSSALSSVEAEASRVVTSIWCVLLRSLDLFLDFLVQVTDSLSLSPPQEQ